MSAGAAGAAAAAIAQAVKASGVIVRVEPGDFAGILSRQPGALVVHATGGIFSTNYQYLMSYKGLAFFTKSPAPLDLPRARSWLWPGQSGYRGNAGPALRQPRTRLLFQAIAAPTLTF